jgi:hypothetical protein
MAQTLIFSTLSGKAVYSDSASGDYAKFTNSPHVFDSSQVDTTVALNV